MEKLELIEDENGLELVHRNGNWVLKKEVGFSPVQTMVASVAACSTYVYQSVLENSNIAYQLHGVEFDYETASEGTVHPVTKINIQFKVTIDEGARERATRGLKLIAKHCPVIQSLADSIVVEEILVFS